MAFLGLIMHFTCLEGRFKVSEWHLNAQNDVLRYQNGIYKVGIAFLGLIMAFICQNGVLKVQNGILRSQNSVYMVTKVMFTFAKK